jgi:hypothetical protein
MSDLLVMKRTSYNDENLDSLVIQNKYLTDDDWKKIESFVFTNKNIHVLELSGININSSGLLCLNDIIRKNNHIKEIKLDWNNFNDIGSEFDSFCESIAYSNLICIYLNNNRIGGTNQLGSICKIIKQSQSIALLDLRWNEITDEGLRYIIESLNKNTNIQHLNIVGNKILNNKLLKELSDILERNRQYQLNNVKSIQIHNKIEGKQQTIKDTFYPTQLSILEKERDLSEEFKARYDVQLITNAKLEKRIKELEMSIKNSKDSITEVKEETQQEILKERNLRKKNESLITELRDQMTQKEIQYQRKINQLESLLDKKEQENLSLSKELELIQEAQERTRLNYQENYNILSNEYQSNTNKAKETILYYQQEYEQLKKDFETQITNQSSNYIIKLKSLEDNISTIKSNYDKLLKNSNEQKKVSMELKLNHQLELSEQEKTLTDILGNRHTGEMKTLLNKITMLSETKENLEEKLEKQNKVLSEIRKKHAEEIISIEEKEIKRINYEKLDLNKNMLNILEQKGVIDTTLKERDLLNSRLKAKVNEKNKKIESIMKEKENEMSNLKNKLDSDIKGLKDKISLLSLKNEDLNKTNECLKLKISRLEQNDVRFMENIKNKLGDITI